MLDAAILRAGLQRAPTAIGYALNEDIVRTFSERYVMRTTDPSFDIDTWIQRTNADVVVQEAPLPEWSSTWNGPDQGISTRLSQGHRSFIWDGVVFDVIEVTWQSGVFPATTTMWWIGPDRESVERFANHVAEVVNELEDEVMVFANARWHRSKTLREAIRDATFDTLVLRKGMTDELVADFDRFISAREHYEGHNVPWKRGALFLGPPGNGKTHCVKALVNHLKLPCFYVQSFASPMGTPEAAVAAVFDRARRTTPCVLVLEDLDALLTDSTRGHFLNELDGFASNAGMITIATSNHPERLDPAILERPSRFDRKYHFKVPNESARTAFLTYWREKLNQSFNEARVASATDGFSYAYLQELLFSTLVAWISSGEEKPFHTVLALQLKSLKKQMSHDSERPPASYVPSSPD